MIATTVIDPQDFVAPAGVVVYQGGMDITRDKIRQAHGLLDELDIDLWLVFVRETSQQSDPVLPLVVGLDATWQSFFLYSRSGEAIALVGNLDREDYVRCGCFTEVLTYTEGAGQAFRELISRLDPENIALDYSTHDASADGLTHGMYLSLCEYLKGTPYLDRLISAETVCSKVRSRKTPAEIDLVAAAAALSVEIWDEVSASIVPGMTEKEVAERIDRQIGLRSDGNAFATIVNAGDKTRPGHGTPTDAVIESGDLLHIDFGARLGGYCADLQRLVYYARPGESTAPAELIKAFDLVRGIIEKTARSAVPGVAGHEVDSLARRMLTEKGYPEYQHALGHQLGRSVHDGGALLGPLWERYGRTPTIPLENGNVFTLELEIMLPGIGCVGLEEDVCITDDGGRFICPRQEVLIVK